MPTRLALAVVLVGLLALTGCKNELCIRHSDCDPGFVCSPTGACLAPIDPDGGADLDAGLDASDALTDAPRDAATDALTDAPPDASPDAGIDGLPPVLDDPHATSPVPPEAGQPHQLTPFGAP